MGKKLLVADDSLTIQKVIKLALSHDGYEIQTVADGNELLAQLSLFRPDVVLMDLGLPGKSTFDVKKEVNNTPDLSEIPVVLMASAFEKVDEAKVALLKFDGRLTKPFDPSHLRDVLSKAISTRGVPQDFDPSDLPPPPKPKAKQSPPPAMITPGPADQIELNDPIWSSDSQSSPSLADHISLSPGGTGITVSPQSVEDRYTSNSLPDFESKSSGYGYEPSASNYEPNLDLLPMDEKTDEVRLPTSEEADIRHLTESTVKMSGLDDLDGWNINDTSSRSNLPPMQSIFDQDRPEPALPPSPPRREPSASSPDETRMLRSSPPPAASATSIMSRPTELPSRADEMMADLPTSKDIEEMVEKQVRAQLEDLLSDQLQKQVSSQLEKYVKQSIPDLTERIIKQEIRKLLEGLS